MRDLNLTCHYCGAKCEIDENECTDEFYTQCIDFDCGATGPGCSTPKQAAAAHLSVMPAVRWTSEPPRVPGDYKARYVSLRQHPRFITMTPRCLAEAPPEFWAGQEYAGPIPLPLEPGEGGGA